MPNLWFPLAGLLAGLVAGWLIGQLRAQAQRMKLDNRAVTAESALAELRGQVQQRETDLKIVQETLSEQQAGRVTAETRLAEAQLYIEEQKKFLAGAEQRFSDTFNALAGESLKSNNQAFLDLAKKTLENLITEARGDLSKRQEGVEAVVKPLQETLKKYEVQLRELESHRAEAYGNLNKHLEELKKAHDGLQKETGQLVSALKRPQVRGRWGEITLRRVVEVAGLSRYCDFEEQVSLEGEEGKQRPDLIVRLPGNRTVVVDAKVPLAAYMDAM
ncbi:MAG TPA: DNA recombination protein RmuC, partial [bacterium]|nr:DNA recombination protein RmuC [bacterium]